jgi:hypothetical protein
MADKQKTLFLIIVFLVVFVTLTRMSTSEIQNEFNDTSTSKTFDGTVAWSNLTFVSLPKASNILNASLNITGVREADTSNTVNQTQDAEDAAYILDVNFGNNVSAIDENWGTYGYNTGGNLVLFYVNYSIPNTLAFATWQLKLGATSGYGYHWGHCKLSNGSWYQLYYYQVSTDIFPNVTINSDCLTKSVLELRVDLDSAVSDFADFYEERVIWSNSSDIYPSNITLDVGDDGDYDFIHDGVLRTQNTTLDFRSEISSYLSTCTSDSNGFCSVPLNITGQNGTVQLSNIVINITESPRVNITYPLNGTTYISSMTSMNYTRFDLSTGHCWYSLNGGGTNTSVTCGTNITGLNSGDGNFVWTVWSNDTDNTINFTTVNFTVDTTAPSLAVQYPTSQNYKDIYSYNLSLNATASDAIVGVNAFFYSLNGASNVTFTPNASIIVTNGSNVLIVYANDTLNNINTSTQIQFNLTFTPKINEVNMSNSTISYERVKINTTGLIGYWKLDKNYSIQEDSSMYSSNATVHGARFTTDGQIGGAYDFDGYSRLNVSDADNLEMGLHDFSVSLWLKLKSSQVSDTVYLLDKGAMTGGDEGYNFLYGVSTGIFVYQMNDGGATNLVYSDPEILETNVWHHVVISINRSLNATFYVDSNQIGSMNTTFADDWDIKNSLNLYFGGNSSTYDTLNGTLDEIIMYNHTLTISEIESMYLTTNPTFQEYPNVTINVTSIDEDTPQASLYFEWFVDGVKKAYGALQNIFNYIFTSRNQKVEVIINDTSGYNVTTSFNITTTFIYPLLSITTPNNLTNYSTATVELNYSLFDDNPQWCWWSNNTGVSNQSITCGTNISSIFNEGLNTVILYANDTVNNINSTSRTFRVDTTIPSVSIIHPTAGYEYSYNHSINLNFTASDSGVGLSNCWFNLNHTINITIPSCINITLNASDGFHILYLFANDSLGNLANTSVNFTVSLGAPAINLDYPPDNSYFNRNSNLYLNYTPTDANGIASCQTWHNLNGSFSLNETNTGVTSGLQNYTIASAMSDGSYLWNVYCTDTTAQGRFSSNNQTLITDTAYPTPVILAIETRIGYLAVKFNHTANDTNLNNCRYAVLNNTHGYEVANTSIACNLNDTPFSVPEYTTYTIYFHANDSAGNEKSTTKSFTPVQLSGGGGTTGGGGGTIGESEIPVIAIAPLNITTEYTDLERAIIYATINNYCSFKITQQAETLALQDYSKVCKLTQADLTPIIAKLDYFELTVSEEDLLELIEAYKDRNLVQVFATPDEIVQYDLFSSLLGSTTELQLIPPRIDKPQIIYDSSYGNKTLVFYIYANKDLKSCVVVSDSPELKCTVSNRTGTLEYYLNSTRFSSKLIVARVLFTSTDDEVQELTMALRVFNLAHSTFKTYALIGGGVISLLFVIFILRRKNRRKSAKPHLVEMLRP